MAKPDPKDPRSAWQKFTDKLAGRSDVQGILKARGEALPAAPAAPMARWAPDSATAEQAQAAGAAEARRGTVGDRNPYLTGRAIPTAIRPDHPAGDDMWGNLGELGDRTAQVAAFVPGMQPLAGGYMAARGVAHGSPSEALGGALVAALPVKAPEGFWANLGERASMVNGGARYAGPATADMMPSALGQIERQSLMSRARRFAGLATADMMPSALGQIERRSLMSRARRWGSDVLGGEELAAERRAALTDDLTGLENQRAFNAARAGIDADPNMVWYSTDMQGLKPVNTQYGQEGGNALLRRQSDAARAAIADIPGARVFRDGGDEVVFAIPRGSEHLIEPHLQQAAIPIHANGRLARARLVGSWGNTYAEADRGMQAAKAAAKAEQPLTPALDYLKSVAKERQAAPVRYPSAGRPGGTQFATPRASEAGGVAPFKVTLPNVGGDPTKVTPTVAALKDTPAEVRARLAAARERLMRSFEPWFPQTRGLVDRSLITPDVGITPADAQPLIPRTTPKTNRAAMGQFRGMNSPANVQMIADQMARGQQLGGPTFYDSYGAVEADLAHRGMDPRVLLDASSAGSIRSSVPHELTNMSIINWGLKRGMFDAQSLKNMTKAELDALAAQLRAAVGAEFPASPGLPFMGTHLQTYGNLARDEAPNAFKVPTYRGQKGSVLNPNKGNVPGLVLDTHESVGQTLGSPYHRAFADAGGFTGADYGVQEDIGRQVARGMGLSDRAGQASRWSGGGDITGLMSPPGDYAQIYEDMLAWNADAQGLPAGKLADNLARGNSILFPDYGKSGLFPR